MTRCLVITTVALTLSIGLSAAVFAASVQVSFRGLPKTTLSFDMGDKSAEWALESQTPTSASYSSEDCRLDVKVEKQGIQQILGFSLRAPSGQQLVVRSYSAEMAVPGAKLHSVMCPNIKPIGRQLQYFHQTNKWRENVPLYRCLTTESFEEEALANNDNPFILLTDNKGNNRFSVGWAKADTASKLRGKVSGSDYTLILQRQEDQPLKTSKLQDALVISSAVKPWIDVKREYAKNFDRFNDRKHSPTPEWATDPHFCTWYCYLHEINEELVMNVARKCSELGFGVLVIDAGWDAKPGMWWGDLDNGIIGDYIAAPDRFPNLRGNVKEMQDMGLKVLLWAAPFWQARQSQVYLERTKDWHVWTSKNERYELCPKFPDTPNFFRETFRKVATDYGINGMWLDTADSVPHVCAADHEHVDDTMGHAWVECMSAIRDGLRSVNPEAITEARILHANLNSKIALDVVQCGDSPETYEMIRIAQIHLRPWAYDVVLKTDPIFWPKGTDDVTVGKYLATMVCSGVPDFSVDVLSMTDNQLRMTKAWLAFYKDHKKTLLKGKFSLFGEDYGIPDMMFTGAGEAIVYMKNDKTKEVVLPRNVRRAILINCTDRDRLDLSVSIPRGRYAAQTFKPDWTVSDLPVALDSDGRMRFFEAVPQGGAVVIEKR